MARSIRNFAPPAARGRLDGRYFNGSNDETGTLLTAGINYRF